MKILIAIIIVAIVMLGIFITKKPGESTTSGSAGIHTNEPDNPDDKDNEDNLEE